MVFALEHLQEMERRYPGVLSMMEKHDIRSVLYGKNIPDKHKLGMLALMHWRRDKVIYHLAPETAEAIIGETESTNYKIPVSVMRHLPYPCIAISLAPFSVVKIRSMQYESYTGEAYLWRDKDILCTAWRVAPGDEGIDEDEYSYVGSSVELIEGQSLTDCFDVSVEKRMSEKFTSSEINKILQILGVPNFGNLSLFTEQNYDNLKKHFGEEKTEYIMRYLERGSIDETLIQRAIHTILYLNCTNADIESAQEKLKAGAWASLIGGEQTTSVPRAVRRQAIRENEGAQVMDVGYRIAGKFRKGLSGDNRRTPSPGEETIARGYGKRRAHFHHYWVGPRDGKIADDIMNPKPGERGLVLKWIEATEIHPELRDDLTVVVPVE